MTTQQLRKLISVEDYYLFYNGLELTYTLNGTDYTILAGVAETKELLEDCGIISIDRSGAIHIDDDPHELGWAELVEGLQLTSRDAHDIAVMHESKKQFNGIVSEIASIPDIIRQAI